MRWVRVLISCFKFLYVVSRSCWRKKFLNLFTRTAPLIFCVGFCGFCPTESVLGVVLLGSVFKLGVCSVAGWGRGGLPGNCV